MYGVVVRSWGSGQNIKNKKKLPWTGRDISLRPILAWLGVLYVLS